MQFVFRGRRPHLELQHLHFNQVYSKALCSVKLIDYFCDKVVPEVIALLLKERNPNSTVKELNIFREKQQLLLFFSSTSFTGHVENLSQKKTNSNLNVKIFMVLKTLRSFQRPLFCEFLNATRATLQF